ncbi:LppX_LprAFG lipoprotein [Mycobacterium sp. URHB0044]|jgi:lipoprotein LprG|uniref:LppX_LprAFG lipoprotein n=1 Tax=Mycobacterium sp. URHB0044 TaxID=1380386 RepID=UPI00048E1F8B|nr:LppX_LprAFG lipoprotein [Mycobacterium sp. URHB0044]
MQTRPRLAVLVSLFTALLAAIALTAGCSSEKKADAALPDAATLLKDSNETTKAQQSVHLQLTVNGEIKELPIASLTGDLTNSPAVAAQGKADIIFLGQKLEGVDFVVADGSLYGAITAGSWQDFGPAADIYDVSAILSPDKGLANVLANFSDPKTEGRETVNGVDTVKVTGTVSADAVNKIAPQIGATGPVPGTAWIVGDGDHKLIQAKLEPTPGNSVQMTMSDWGKSVTVTKPAV